MRTRKTLITAALLGAALGHVAATAAESPGPTLAVEDTMFTELPEVLVQAPRVTLAEILDRVAEGEARREAALNDQAFTSTMRVMTGVGGKHPELMVEKVYRVYKKRPDKVRSVLLRETGKHADDDDLQVEFSPRMGEQIVNHAFRAEARHDYRYWIENRTIVGDHLVYEIAFEPRSSLDWSTPSGRVWVDTNDFVIVREELAFKRSPVPLFIRGIDRVVIERTRVGGHWILGRVLMRVRTSIPLPKVGRAFDMTLLFSDYALNSGLSDALFIGTRKGGS